MMNLPNFFQTHDLYYELYEHPALYTNEAAVKMKNDKGFTGTETKSLFLKGKDKRYYVFFTFTTKRTDFKQISALVGKRLSLVSSEEMERVTGQKAGAVSPLGYEGDIPLIIDKELFDQEKLVFAPGRPDNTMVILAKDLEKIIELLQLEYYICD